MNSETGPNQDPGQVAGEMVVEAVKESSGMVVVLGIATLIAGALAIMAPFVAGGAVTMMVAIMLVAAGIARTVFAFQAESWGKGTLTFFLGIATAFCGLLILARPLMALATLTLVLAAYLFADGIFECIAAFRMKPLPGWVWMLVSGIVSLVLGFMIARNWPNTSWAIGVLVGVRLIFAGWSMIALGALGRGAAAEAKSAIAG